MSQSVSYVRSGLQNAESAAAARTVGRTTGPDRRFASEIVFIDARVDDLDTLLGGLVPGARVRLLDPARDGLDQIVDALRAEGAGVVSGIAIVAHGAPGRIGIGPDGVTADALSARAPALAAIGAAVAPGGGMRLYCCETGAGPLGARFVAALSEALGGLPVAASSRVVGSARHGGTWNLDVGATAGRGPAPFDAATLAVYAGTLGLNGGGSGGNDQPNARPSIDDGANTIDYTENGAGTPINSTLTLRDEDSTNLAGAVIKISGNFETSDRLNYSDQSGITGSYDAGNGTLTLTGSATLAAYKTALHSVTFSSVSDNPSTANRTVSFTVNDGTDDSAASFSTVRVTAVNDAPVNTVGGTQTLREDAPATVVTGLSISDVDGGGASNFTTTLTATKGTLAVTTVSNGATVSGSGAEIVLTGTIAQINTTLNGHVTYTPAAGANGAAQITMKTDDGGNSGGSAQSDTDVKVLSITSVNDAPAGADKTVTTLEDTAYTFTAADFGFTDPNDSPANALAAVKISTGPSAGTLTDNGVAVTSGQSVSVADINAGLLKFTPAANANGTGYAGFTFQVQDNGGTTDGGQNLAQSPNTITVNVTPVNDAPVNTVGGTQTLREDAATVLTGLSISDVDGGSSFTTTLSTSAGTLSVMPGGSNFSVRTVDGVSTVTLSGRIDQINASLNGRVSFQPKANLSGSAEITMTTNDGGNSEGPAQSSTATKQLSITAVNDAPAGTDKTVTTLEDNAYTFTTTDFGFTDTADSPANALAAVKISTLPTGASGSLAYDGTAITAAQVTAGYEVSAADITAGKLKYVPAANANGSPEGSFTFQVRDGGGTADGGQDLAQSANTITVNVTPVADTPSVTGATTNEDTQSASGLVVSRNSADGSEVGFVKISNIQQGTLYLADGSTAVAANSFITYDQAHAGLKFTPARDFNGTGSFDVQAATSASDTGLGGSVVTASVAVQPVNDAPVIDLNGAGTGIDNTAANTELAARTTLASGVTLSDVDAGARITGATVAITAGLIATADELTVGNISSSRGGGISYNSDFSTGRLTLTGTATLGEYQSLLSQVAFYTSSNNPGTSRTITWTVNDGTANSATATTTVTVTPVNDAPVVTAPATVTVREDVASAITGITLSDVDANGASETVTLTVGSGALAATSGGGVAVGGSATALTLAGTLADINAFVAASKLTYTTAQDANGTVALGISLNDGGATGTGGAKTGTGSTTLAITPVNDAPTVAISALPGATEHQRDDLKGHVTIADVDAGSGTVQATLSVDTGRLELAAGTSGATIASGNGTTSVVVTGTVAQINALLNGNATSSFDYLSMDGAPPASARLTVSVNDGGNTGGAAQTGSASAAIAITAVNDIPSLSPSTAFPASFTEGGAATPLFENTTVLDPDQPASFAGGRFSLLTTGDGGIGLKSGSSFAITGNTIVLAGDPGIVIGTIAGVGTVDLRVTGLTAATTPARVDDLITDFVYANASDTPSAGTRSVRLTFNDGGNTGSGAGVDVSGTQTLAVTAVNDAPVVTAGGTTAYTENGAAVVIAPAATVTDVDSADFAGGSLSVAVTGAGATDQLAIANQGTGAGQIGVAGANVSYGGTPIGSVSGGANGAALVVSLNAGATQAAVTALMRDVTYASTSDDPAASRTVTFTVNDGDGIANGGVPTGSASTTVQITPVNDAPTLTTTAANTTFTEAAGAGTQGAAVAIFGQTVVSTVEAGQSITGLSFTVAGLKDGANEVVTVDGTAIGLGAASSATTAGHGLAYAVALSSDSTTAIVTLTRAAGVSAAVAAGIVDGLRYQDTNLDNPSLGARTITLTQIVDSGGGNATTGLANAATVTVVPVNDAPVISGDGAIAVLQGGSFVLTTEDLSATDVDNAVDGLTYMVSGQTSGSVLVTTGSASAVATSFTQAELAAGRVGFRQDGSANTAAGFTVTVDDGSASSATKTVTAAVDLIPVVTGIAYGQNDGTLRAGESVDLVVTFSEAVTASGNPTLALNDGGTAILVPGSTANTTTLTFRHTVLAGQNTADLAVTGIVASGGASIKDSAGQTVATLVAGGINPAGLLVVDTVAPAAPGVVLVNDTGFSAGDGITSDPTILYGAVAAGDTLAYRLDGGQPTSTQPIFTRDGTADGRHTVAVTVTDTAGNVSSEASLAFTLDTLAPTARPDTASGTGVVTKLSGNLLANDSDASAIRATDVQFAQSLVKTVPGTGTTEAYAAHGSLTVAADGSYSYQPRSSGRDSFSYTVTDAAGNTSRSTLTVDVAKAAIPASLSLAFALTDAKFDFSTGHDLVTAPNGTVIDLTGVGTISFTDGTVQEADGAPLVDDLFYYAKNLDVWRAQVDPDTHYASFGWREGRDPNELFSTKGYLAANPDVAGAGINPLTHYETFGVKEGRSPGADFSAEAYRAANPDVARAGIDPLTHYLGFGQAEDRFAFPGATVAKGSGDHLYGDFDATFYLRTNTDVAKAAAASGINADSFAFTHYLTFGAAEGRDPDAFFSTKGYLAANPDVAASGQNPLLQYASQGWFEGRDPGATFHTNAYLVANPDVAAAHVDPLQHYLQFGMADGRMLG